ncbi:hypothetical protein CO026_02785 [Candidatus Kaiserbacteria bacterium CG_4_9_14_0_2_um_filter_41_32]|uniref:histidine kinase n=1 Tax=Candidatus Kaiserbacteria bacterium CG_4_9_14_0_2_um_filter_41_32 TaxID=1974601 RepID=A0A2M8FEF8_9BACT|nr:MAG: hypothetical protein CO026_02785 [Candidatus Kaiserbacteria bacterium CG_4_9_14_0_2_um_filter_41_32]
MKILMKLHNKLAFQLGFPFFLLVVFLNLAVGVISYRSYIKDTAQVQSIPARVAQTGSERVETFFDQLHFDIKLAAQSTRLPLHEETGFLLQDIVRINPSIIELAVFDQDGKEMYLAEEVTTHISLPGGDDITKQDYFIETIDHRKEYISNPLTSIYNTPYIIWSVPVIIDESTVVMMRAVVDISTLWETIALVSEKDIDGAHVYIVDSTGTILVSNIDNYGEQSGSAKRVLDIVSKDPPVFTYTGQFNVEVGGKAELLPPTNWTIIAEIPLDTLMAETRSNLNILYALAFIFFCLTLYELYALRKYLFEPISEFTKMIKKLSAGNYQTRVTLQIDNELASLATVMNQMAEQVNVQTSGIIEKLQQTVVELNQSAGLLIRRDLELTRANEKLKQLDDMKSDFVSLVTHQLRTPLSGIRWSLSMLINNEMGELNPDQKLYLMKTYESNNRMISLINDMLNADRVDSGTLKFKFALTDLVDLIDNVLVELWPHATKKDIKLKFFPREEVPKVLIDPENMRVVLQNLIDNAIKYSKNGTEVRIGIKQIDNNVEIAVENYGIGIPADQQSKIFTRFFRAPNAVHTETDGSGLGLYIVASIVKKHHGTIRFSSTENESTTFYVTLPLNKSL